jgi:hypothetical protein
VRDRLCCPLLMTLRAEQGVRLRDVKTKQWTFSSALGLRPCICLWLPHVDVPQRWDPPPHRVPHLSWALCWIGASPLMSAIYECWEERRTAGVRVPDQEEGCISEGQSWVWQRVESPPSSSPYPPSPGAGPGIWDRQKQLQLACNEIQTSKALWNEVSALGPAPFLALPAVLAAEQRF